MIFSFYAVGVTLLFVALLWWKIKNRPTKHPLGLDVKLRRQAGEHLRKESEKLMETLVARLAILILLPAAGCILPAWVVGLFASTDHVGVLVAMASLLLAGLIWALRWCLQLTDKIQNYRLGWFGERVVADALEVLKTQGFSVFHDMPCLGATGPFNLDHVVVGNGIVVVVETKTHRKLKAGSAVHKVSYDGEKLIWPTGQSTQEIEQVLLNAEWLKKELKKQLGFDVNVRAALTMPGWYVTGGHPKAPVLVENHTRLPKFIAQRFPAELFPEQTKQIILHLEARCSDVTYEMM